MQLGSRKANRVAQALYFAPVQLLGRFTRAVA